MIVYFGNVKIRNACDYVLECDVVLSVVEDYVMTGKVRLIKNPYFSF